MKRGCGLSNTAAIVFSSSSSSSNVDKKAPQLLLKNIISAVSAAVIISSFCDAAVARDNSAGTKTDKGFELCVSKCTFAASRPPPVGSSTERLAVTMSRGEVITMCKNKCATTKEQTMIGEPKKNKQPLQDNTQN